MKIGFIGAGKAGFTLGRYFAENGVELSGYFSRSRQSAEEAASFAGGNVFDDAQQLVMASDAVFITTPDAAIRQTYLSLRDVDLNGKQICHCSGALCAKEAFPDIRERGGRGYSIHPLFPISSKYESYKAIGSAYFTIEGDGFDTDEWRAFFERLGNSVKILSGEHKTGYHAACAVSSNLVCALIAQSTGLLAECGFSQEQALLALKPLITANIENVLKTDPTTALTGPVERCDCETVRRHMDCFDNETDLSLYRSASLKLVGMAQKKHPETDYSELERILKKTAPSD